MRALCLALLPLALVAGACSAAAPDAVGSGAAADTTNGGRGGDGNANATVDPSYVEHWVIAPGQTGDISSVDLRADGTYEAQTRYGDESGTWGVIDLQIDWIFTHTITLTSSAGKARTYGSEASATQGYFAIYPDQDTHQGFTLISKSRNDALPATCDFETQNCNFPDVLSCVPADSHLQGGTCTTAATQCFSETGCDDPSAICVVSHAESWGICVKRAGDVPSCSVAAQDCADPTMTCIPHDAAQASGLCQKAAHVCRTADDWDCGFYGGTCVPTNAGKMICARKPPAAPAR